MAGRASAELFMTQFFLGKTLITDARVVRVRQNAVVLFLPKYGIEGVVYLGEKGSKEVREWCTWRREQCGRGGVSSLSREAILLHNTGREWTVFLHDTYHACSQWTLDEGEAVVTHKESGKSITLFQPTGAKVVVVDKGHGRRELQVEMVERGWVPPEELV